jgi:hypothetical protein
MIGSNWIYRGIATSKLNIDPTSANHLANRALWSPPVASTTIPTKIGSQITKVNRGKPNNIFIPFYLLSRSYAVSWKNTALST